MPFGILLAGDSGIGKSTLIEYIFHYFGKYKKLPTLFVMVAFRWP
jgi:serine kinase of HPr protein (carbohydrate metabolism regulator)